MRFVLMHYRTQAMEDGVPPTAEQQGAINEFIGDAIAARVLVAGEGLDPSSAGARIDSPTDTPASSTDRSPKPKSSSAGSGSSTSAPSTMRSTTRASGRSSSVPNASTSAESHGPPRHQVSVRCRVVERRSATTRPAARMSSRCRRYQLRLPCMRGHHTLRHGRVEALTTR
jgi:hypothetical protein